MFIKMAHAAGEAATDIATEAMPAVPSAGDAFVANMVLILLLVVMFYLLLIRPQQKRFREHADMLQELDKGTKVITQGGLIGKIDKINGDEIVLDLGGSQKVTIVRSAISSVYEAAPGNDNKKETKAEAAKDSKKKTSKK